MAGKNPILIAEIGCSHAGSLERAFYLSDLACSNGADVIKFQKRNPEESVPDLLKQSPHPNPYFSYGSTYLEHRKNLELCINDHLELKNLCEKNGKKYACSVWDFTSAREVIDICPFFIKIPSACNLNNNLIEYVLNNYVGNVHISLGMVNYQQRESILSRYGQNKNVLFYHCTSEYPCKFENLYLKEIKYLYERFGDVGFSNHGYGIAADIAAIALGCSCIERHFIDDRTFRHTDAAASLEPNGFKTLKRDILNVSLALSYRSFDMTETEKLQSKKMRT